MWRKFVYLAILLLVLKLLFFREEKAEVVETEQNEVLEKLEKLRKDLPAAKVKKPVKETAPKLITVRPPPPKKKRERKIPKGSIEFEVVNGEAIAYGDVILGKVQSREKVSSGLYYPKNNSRLWPSSVIPYHIQPDLPNPERVHEVIEYFNKNTVMDFVPFEGQEDAIVFTKSEQLCASYLGMTGGHQPIRLSEGCGFKQITHEIMHALGFVHEQSRVDRDEYVEVIWENIEEKYQSQFDIVPDFLIHPYKGSVFDFDYKSVMLYDPRAFAKKDLLTMESLTNEKIAPTLDGLSEVDLDRLYFLYGP